MALQQPDDAGIITVIIPTFNRRDLLIRAIASVRSETRVPLRIAVFDNASSDGTRELMARLVNEDDRIIYVRRDENVGGLKNYSLALGSITTGYFTPLADDDLLLPDFLFKAHQLMEADRRLGAAVFVTEARDEDGRTTDTYPAHLEEISFGRLSPRQHMSDWLCYGHYSWTSVLWRREVLDVVGPPYFHAGLPSDIDFQAKVFCSFDVHIVNEAGAVLSLHAGQASRTLSIADLTSWAKIFERLDLEVNRHQLYEYDEYLKLRQVMWDRFRGIWNLKSDEIADPALATRLAVTAAFRLGDWSLAVRLAEVSAQIPPEQKVSTGPIRSLPGTTSLAERRPAAGGRLDFFREIILWMDVAIRERQAIEGRYATACEWGVAAEARIADAETRAEIAERRLSSICRHPVVRWLGRAGVIRIPQPTTDIAG